MLIWSGSGADLGRSGADLDLGWIWSGSGSGVDLERIWIWDRSGADLGRIWSGASERAERRTGVQLRGASCRPILPQIAAAPPLPGLQKDRQDFTETKANPVVTLAPHDNP